MRNIRSDPGTCSDNTETGRYWQTAALKEAALKTQQSIRHISWRMGSAACAVSAAALVLLLAPPTELSATQDESAASESTAAPLRVPDDMTEEAIEQFDMDLAAAAGPLLRTVFNPDESDDARLSAAGQVAELVEVQETDSAGLSAMKRRIERRVALVEAIITAGGVDNPLAGGSAATQRVNEAAEDAVNWLATVRNGDLWVSFLRLDELQDAAVSADTLSAVNEKYSQSGSWSDEQQEFFNKPQIQTVQTAVATAIEAANPPDADQVRSELRALLGGMLRDILAHEIDHVAAPAERARRAYQTLRDRFPGAAAVVRPMMLDQYLNYNLHFSMSETLLSRIVSDYRTESGCIAECVMGAWVTGSSVTSVNVKADIRRSADRANFALVLNGNTQSNTRGRREPATVFTRGNHYFTITKPVWFDGERVTYDRGRISVDPNNQTVGIRTDYDGIPLLGHIVRDIAAKKVAEGRAESEAYTARKVVEEALPQFEEETRKQLQDMDTEIHDKILAGLRERDIAPDQISARSSETHIAVSSRTLGPTRLGGSVRPPLPLSPTGLVVQVHESAVNNSTDALGLNGRTLKEDEVGTEIEKSLSEILHRDISLSLDDDEADAAAYDEAPETDEDAEPPSTFVFSETDPIRVMFGEGEVTLILRTGVLQEGKEDIPEQIIRIPIAISLADGKLILEPGTIAVSSKDEADRLKQVTRANQIRRILGERFVRKELDPTLELQNASDETITLTLQSIRIGDGWVNAELQ